MSNEPRWTPGPWSARLVDEGPGSVFVVARGRVIADVEYPNDDANAKLIAAAPRIYSSLDELRRLFASGRGATDGDLDIDEREFERAILEAEEALAQARGES